MKNSLLLLSLAVVFFLFYNSPEAQWVQTNGPFGGSINLVSASGNKVAVHSENVGVFLSFDKAKSWSTVNNDQLSNWVTSILIRGDIILLGEVDGGLFISTNNGASWEKNFSGTDNFGIEALAESGETIYAGSTKGLFQSTDNASSWTRVEVDSSENPVVSIAAKDSMLVIGTGAGIFVSLNKGVSWKRSTGGLPEKATGKVVINGSHIFAAIDGKGVYTSADSGATWTQANSGLPSNPYFYSLISDGNLVLAALGSYGIYKWNDSGSAWQASSKGIQENIQVKSIAASGGSIYAGTFGAGVFISADEGSSWSKSNNGLNALRMTALASRGDSIFVLTQYSGIFFADAGLLNWEFLNVPDYENYFINVMAFDSKNMYVNAGQNGIIRSTDNGQSWEAVNNGIAQFREGFSVILAHKNKMFAATYDSPGWKGALYFSTNAGDEWVKVTSGITDFSALNSLASNGSDIFAVSHGKVYLSTDDGSSWQLANNGLEGKEVWLVKANANAAFASTVSDGAFRSTDKGQSWTAVGNELAGRQVFSFVCFGDSTVLAGTNGAGVYISLDNGLSWQSESVSLPQKDIIFLEKSGNYIFARNDNYLWRAAVSELTPALPSVPKLLAAANNSKNQPLNVRLSWEQAENAEWYHLQVAKDSLFKDLILDDPTVTALTKDVTELSEGRIFFWRLRAGSGAGVSQWSEVWNFTTVLRRPDSLNLAAVTKGIKISWKDNSVSESGFVIERMQTEDFTTLDTVKANTTGYTDTTAVQSAYYHYRVKAFNQYAVSDYSDTISIMLTYAEAGRANPGEYFLFQNYPNPFNPVTLIRYNLPLESSVRIAIYNSLGKTVKEYMVKDQSAGLHEISFDAKGISSGVYFYIFEARATDGTKDFRQIKKMIILK
ncbi:MAG: YCF48-related protein [Acidobacteriota bacterium]